MCVCVRPSESGFSGVHPEPAAACEAETERAGLSPSASAPAHSASQQLSLDSHGHPAFAANEEGTPWHFGGGLEKDAKKLRAVGQINNWINKTNTYEGVTAGVL